MIYITIFAVWLMLSGCIEKEQFECDGHRQLKEYRESLDNNEHKFSEHLAPPSVNELPIHPGIGSIEETFIKIAQDDLLRDGIGDRVGMKFRFIESKIILTQAEVGNGHETRFSIWMPNQDTGDDYVLVSYPGLLTPQSIMLVHELLRSF